MEPSNAPKCIVRFPDVPTLYRIVVPVTSSVLFKVVMQAAPFVTYPHQET